MNIPLIAALLLASLNAADSRSTKPNVLLIITDDQGYGDFSIHGNPYLQTPHIDQLGEGGRAVRPLLRELVLLAHPRRAADRALAAAHRVPRRHPQPRGDAARRR